MSSKAKSISWDSPLKGNNQDHSLSLARKVYGARIHSQIKQIFLFLLQALWLNSLTVVQFVQFMRKAGSKHVAGLEAVCKVRHMQYLFHFPGAFLRHSCKKLFLIRRRAPDVNSNNTFLKFCIKKEALCRYNESYKTVADVFFKKRECML